jgi:type IV secretory pathway TrbL component
MMTSKNITIFWSAFVAKLYSDRIVLFTRGFSKRFLEKAIVLAQRAAWRRVLRLTCGVLVR